MELHLQLVCIHIRLGQRFHAIFRDRRYLGVSRQRSHTRPASKVQSEMRDLGTHHPVHSIHWFTLTNRARLSKRVGRAILVLFYWRHALHLPAHFTAYEYFVALSAPSKQ